MITKEKADAMILALYNQLGEAGERDRLSRATLAKLAGMSHSRFSQMRHNPGTTAFCLLRMRQALQNISQAEKEGWLPAASRTSAPQKAVLKRLLEM